MPDWLKILIPSLIGLLTTVVAAYFSARWAMRRAFQERWWERKERAYSEIIEALHDMIRYAELCANEYMSPSEHEHAKKEEFRVKYREAFWKIERATDIGAFVICEDVATILDNLRRRPKLKWEENAPWEIYEEDTKHYREALAGIRRCARRDLKV
jgi:hypothetical protein